MLLMVNYKGVYRLYLDLFYLLVHLKNNGDALLRNYEDWIYSLYEYCEVLFQTFLGYLQ
jgi:hypothetical protein